MRPLASAESDDLPEIDQAESCGQCAAQMSGQVNTYERRLTTNTITRPSFLICALFCSTEDNVLDANTDRVRVSVRSDV